MDEIDYSKPVEGQKPIPVEQHWRKHTLSTIGESGETKLDYRPVIDETLDAKDCANSKPSDDTVITR